MFSLTGLTRRLLFKTKLSSFKQYQLANLGEDFWRWQTMNPQGYRTGVAPLKANKESGVVTNGTSHPVITNGNH